MPVPTSIFLSPILAALAIAPAIIKDDIIQPGDRIHIVCAEEPSLNRDYRVTPQGLILVDFLGSVKVAGMSKMNAAQAISAQLVHQKVLPTANVKVDEAAATTASDPITSVHWSGQVENPGYVPYHPGLSLADVWPSIHPAPMADISVIQIINPKLTPRNVILGPTTDLNQIPLQAEDEIIFVQKMAPLSKVYVGGDVVNPGNYDVTSTTTVSDLIREAGGPTPYGDPGVIQFSHGGGDGKAIRPDDNNFHPTDGDRIIVGKRNPDMTISVTGGVKKPGTFGFYSGAKLSEAFEKAGGLAKGADVLRVHVFSPDQPKGITVDYAEIQKGYVGDMVLKPGMRIEVPAGKHSDRDETVRYAAGAAVLLWLLGK